MSFNFKFSRLQKFLFAAVAVLFFIAAPSALYAQLPFGGRIVFWKPVCMTPPGIEIMVGAPSFMNLMYIGAMSFEYGPPSHIGQYLLGKASFFWTPCIIWPPCPPVGEPCPIIIGGGFPIIYHGSSI